MLSHVCSNRAAAFGAGAATSPFGDKDYLSRLQPRLFSNHRSLGDLDRLVGRGRGRTCGLWALGPALPVPTASRPPHSRLGQ